MSKLKRHYSKIIIGSGPCGLGAGLYLTENNFHDFIILEKEKHYGGLATSFIDTNGFTWDIGGHVQFSHYPYFDQAMEKAIPKDKWLHHQRSAWVWIYNNFVPYPFQNNIHRLPYDKQQECLLGLENIKKGTLNNFKDWIIQSFGDGIATHFLLPYNYKVWAFSPEKLNFAWIGERVATVDLNKIKENIKLNRDDISWGPNNTFQFPLQGGTGAIWNNIARIVGEDKIQLNTKIFVIDVQNKIIRGNFGEISYDEILSTMPVNELCKLIEPKIPSLIEASSQLRFSSSHIVGVGVEGLAPEHLKDKCWMYFPESNCPFYRVTVFSNYSPYNTPNPKKYFSLMTETSSSTDKKINLSNLENEVIEGLINTNLLSKKHKIQSTWQYTANYGYPTPSLQRDSVLNKVIPELEKFSIYSRGRFGGWKYEVSNQDHTFMQGAEWASFRLHQKRETTLRIDRDGFN